MRKFLIILLLILAVSFSAGQVSHEIEAGVDQAVINTTVRLDCDRESSNCPVNRWRLSWNLPEDAEIISIKDSLGEVEDYEVEGDKVSFTTTESDERRTSETVKIRMRINRGAQEIYEGLYQRSFSLAGFSGEETTGSLRNDNLLSGWTSHGFDTAYSDEYLNFTGEGSVSIRTKFGEGQETKYYEFFGGEPQENTELAYEVSVGTTGIVQDFQRFPVASMDSRTFNETVAKWSSGEYIGGSIKIRENLEKKDFLAVLAHETVHGLNDRQFNWDRTRSSYIEEGTGKYVEFLMNKKLKGSGRVRELFGEPVKYEEERNGKDYIITLPPSGRKEKLWEYYQQDKHFMKTWTPMDSAETRDFGYAYSQLIIRNYISRMDGSMSDIYRQVRPEQKVESAQEKWRLYSQVMDMEPCRYESRERFNECLEKINEYDYKVLRATEIDRGERSIQVTPIEVPNRTTEDDEGLIPDFSGEKNTSNSSTNGTADRRDSGYNIFFSWLQRLFENILQSFN
jgi:hypothetical protein